MANDLARLSLSEIQDRLEQHDLSSVDITRFYLERISEFDSKLNAFITVLHDRALADAADADARRGRGDRSPLLGVPVAIKDLFATAWVRTTAGSQLLANNVPDHDATVVERLRAAGAVILGKTNMMELAYGYPHPDYGETSNPWDLRRTAGGSSGGSAAAVAAGLAAAGLGSDTGGSIRSPAAYCGIVGLKATYGAVSRHGVVPLSWSLDHAGPLTRTVRDAALVFDTIVGWDHRDPASVKVAIPATIDALEEDGSSVLIGVVSELFERHVEPEVARVARSAIERLSAEGFDLIDIDLPLSRLVSTAIMPIIQAEATSIHWPALCREPESFSKALRQNLRLGALVLAKEYLDAQRLRRMITDEVNEALTRVDVLVFPTQPIVAPVIGAYELAEDVADDVLDVEIGHTGLANLTGHPAVSIPCGLTDAGLPVGLQITGHLFEERALLRLAHRMEQVIDFAPLFAHHIDRLPGNRTR